MKYLRLKKRKEITKIIKTGKRARRGSISVVYFPSKQVKMAVCVGKKFGKSVQRNRIKRLLREAFSCYASKITPAQAFLLIPKEAETYSFFRFRQDVEKLLIGEGLLDTAL